MWGIAYSFPILFLLAMAALALIPLSKGFLCAAIYFPLLVLFSFFLSLKNNQIRLAPYVILIYLIQHFGYALGEVYGLLSPSVK